MSAQECGRLRAISRAWDRRRSPTIFLNGFFCSGLGLRFAWCARAQMGALFWPESHFGEPQWRRITAGKCGDLLLEHRAAQPDSRERAGGSARRVREPGNVANISGPLGALITDHTSAGVELYANSQAYFLGTNQVMRNGSSTDPRSAGIRLDGNSEVFSFVVGKWRKTTDRESSLSLTPVRTLPASPFLETRKAEIITCDSSSWV